MTEADARDRGQVLGRGRRRRDGGRVGQVRAGDLQGEAVGAGLVVLDEVLAGLRLARCRRRPRVQALEQRLAGDAADRDGEAATVMTTQTSTNRHGCRAATPPSRASRVVGDAAEEDSLGAARRSPGPPQACCPGGASSEVATTQRTWRAASDPLTRLDGDERRDGPVRPGPGRPGRGRRRGDRRQHPPAARRPDAPAHAGRGARPGRRAAPRQPAAPPGRGVRRHGRPALGDHLGTAGHRQDHPGPPRRQRVGPPVRRAVRRHRGRQGRPRGHGPGPPRPRPVRPRRRCCSSTRSTGSPRPSRTRCCPAWRTGWVVLVAATTENPSFSVISPLLSRSLAAHPAAARATRRSRDAASTPRSPTSAGWPAASPWPTTPGRTWSGSPAATPGGRSPRSRPRPAWPSTPSRSAPTPTTRPWASRLTHTRTGRAPRPPSATTGPATSTTTWPARSSSRCAAATSTQRCTTWRGCWRPGRTPGSSPGASSSRRARTSGWPTRPRCRPRSRRCTPSPRSACPRRGSSWPRPSSTTRWRRSPTPPTSPSGQRSPTCGPGRAARCRRTCGGAATRGPRAWGTATGMRTRTTRPTASPRSSTSRTTWPARTDYYRPTDRGFEERLAARLAWLKERLANR